MRNLLLSVVLIAAPVAVFAAGYTLLAPAGAPAAASAAGPSLGDMTPYAAIVTDVQGLALKGDMAGAKARITDFETAWDEAEPTLRPKNKSAWGNVDDAADAALSAVRAGTPDPAEVKASLADLQAALADPQQAPGAAPAGAPATVSGVATTDADGRALPCEEMLKAVRAGLASPGLSADVTARATDLQARATERCNADDDRRADDFSAQALALLPK